MPSKAEVERQLEELMVRFPTFPLLSNKKKSDLRPLFQTTLGFEETQKKALRQLPPASKWKMILSNSQITNLEVWDFFENVASKVNPSKWPPFSTLFTEKEDGVG